MKIQLIQPPEPTYNPPMGGFGLACLAAYVEDIADTTILDPTQYNMTMREVLAQVEAWNPDLVGLSLISTPSIYRVLRFAEQIKRVKPGCRVVFGGHSATFLVDDVLRSGWVDVVVRGEGEIPFRRLIQNDGNPNGIPGLSYLRDGEVVHTGPGEIVQDMDQLRMPAYHLLDQSVRFFHLIESSRGCPFRCNFCATARFYNNTWRAKSPERIVEEIKFLLDNYNVLWIFFSDDSMGVDMQRLERLSRLLIEEQIETNFLALMRADQVVKNPDTIALMAQAGFRAVQIGLESPHQESLNGMHKGTSRSQNERAVELLHANDIFLWGFFIIGAPGETPEMMRQTYDFAKQMNVDGIGFSIYTPLPGTDLYEQCQAQGTLISDNWEDYDCHHRVMKDTSPETLRLSYQFNRDYYYRAEWIVKHLDLKSSLQRLSLARIFWSQNVNNKMGGPPESLESWQQVARGYGAVLNPTLAQRLPDYAAAVCFDTELGAMALAIRSGQIQSWTACETGRGLTLQLSNETLSYILVSMGLDFLSALLLRQVVTMAPLSELLRFCRWVNAVQTEMELAPGGPAHEMPACVGAINELMMAAPNFDELKAALRGFRKSVRFRAPHGSIVLRLMGPRMLYWGLEDEGWGGGTQPDFEVALSDAALRAAICGGWAELSSVLGHNAARDSRLRPLQAYSAALSALDLAQEARLVL